MQKDQAERAIRKLYNFFYYKIYRKNFDLDLSIGKQRQMVESFCKLLAQQFPHGDVGNEFLISYFCWAFFSWKDRITKRPISLGWIIGKKMFAKWKEKNEGIDYHMHKWLKENDIILDNLRADLHEDEVLIERLDQAEELEKLRFHGEARLYNCLMHTTLYNHRSINCIGCENRSVCKGLLAKQYPNIFKKRGYSK